MAVLFVLAGSAQVICRSTMPREDARRKLFKDSNESIKALDRQARKVQRQERRAAWWTANNPNEAPPQPPPVSNL